MEIKATTDKLLFGIKIRQLRMDLKMSAAELADKAGLSVSYLSEIEKGKKFPKQEKLAGLAVVLGTTSEGLVKQELPKQFAPLEELLRSNFLDELPLEAFGVDLSRVVEIIANAPARVGAFISTLVELGRNYSLKETGFFYGALRAYQELTNNYQADIEETVSHFSVLHAVKGREVTISFLSSILKENFNIEVVKGGLIPYPELDSLRALYLPNQRKLLLNPHLSEVQLRFQLAKELGFQVLKIAERAYTSSIIKPESFEEVLNHYRATYFAVALLMGKQQFSADIAAFFSQKKWNPTFFIGLIEKYQVSEELFFQRLSNILPAVFQIDQVFFLRMSHDVNQQLFTLENEMHLNRQFRSHTKGPGEHYCRRWLAIKSLNEVSGSERKEDSNRMEVFAQRSEYYLQNETYLCLSLVGAKGLVHGKTRSITMGILVSEDVKEKIRFVNDQTIPSIKVGSTCERCVLTDCAERIGNPTIVHNRMRRKRIAETVQRLLKE